MNLDKYIWQYRLKKNQVAKDLDITPNYIAGLCQGKYTPSIKLAIRIIEYSQGEIGIHELYPELYEAYLKALENRQS